MTPQLQHAALVVLTLAAGAAWLWAADRRWRLRLAVAAAVGALALLVDPSAIPLEWLTPLQEGDSDHLARLAVGDGQHAGPTWTRLLAPWGRVDGVGRLDGVARLGLALGAAAWVLWAGLWADVAGWTVGAALALGLLWQPVVRFALFSEGPAPAAWLGLALALSAARQPRGWLAAALWGAWVAGLRVELALIPAAALLAPRIPDLVARARWWWVPLAVAGEVAVRQVPASDWQVRALAPLDPGLLFQPLLWAATLGPAVAAAALRGGWTALRDPGATAGAALAALALTKAYWAAGHGPLLGGAGFVSTMEQLRYLGLWVPVVGWLAAWGARGWTRAWPALLVPGIPAAILLWPDSTSARWGEPGWTVTGPLARDAQVEVREVVGALREGGCVVVVPVVGGFLWIEDGRVRTVTSYPAVSGCVRRFEGVACGHGADCLGTGGSRSGAFPGPYAHPSHGWTAPDGWRWLP